jgi:hypothetical protein
MQCCEKNEECVKWIIILQNEKRMGVRGRRRGHICWCVMSHTLAWTCLRSIYFFSLFSLFFIYLCWGVWPSLRALQLVPTSPKVNDQISLQWPSILAITWLEPETTGRENPLVLSFLSLNHLLDGLF